MSVKASLSGEVIKVKRFPKLMVADGDLIVLFNADRKGIVVNSKRGQNIGDYSIDWAMGAFKDYNGEVTLKNE
jgi:hypothetical protein